MTATEKMLGEFIENEAANAWSTKKTPYLLSALAPDFADGGHDYKSVIGGERLKSAVKRLSDSYKFKVVEHPSQKAKIGVIPKDEDFEFTDDPDRNRPVSSSSTSTDQRQQKVLDFFEILGHLPPDSLDGIVIPTRTLVRLLGRR